MSRAASIVVTWPRTGPEAATHFAPKERTESSKDCSSAAVSGVGSPAR